VRGTRQHLRVGVIGCGFVARHHHLPALDALPELRVVALADTNAAALARASAGRDVRAHPDPAAVLEDPDVDVVAVCTPPLAHAELAQAALEAGRHVLVEKPLAVSLDDGARLVERATGAPGLATVGLVYRWHRLNRAARELVRAGRVGTVSAVQAVATGDAAMSPERTAPWRTDPAQGGGPLLELGTHQVDLWRFVTGAEVSTVEATVGATAATLAARLDDGTAASALLSMHAGDNQELAIYGTAATLRVRADRHDGLELVPAGRLPGDPGMRLRRGARLTRALPGAVRAQRSGGDLAAAFRAQWRAFARAIRGEAPLEVTLADGLRALEAIAAAVPEPVA
jgi:predicted dehydrogenase